MNLLAESGSTKTDWCDFDKTEIYRTFRTTGMNPDIQQAQDIEAQLQQELEEHEYNGSPEKVFFYGAGLKGLHNKLTVKNLLTNLFPSAEIHVEHDLLAAARCACLDAAGITCILGTGSNSCRYDGHDIVESIGGHGYLFGDEGGGADLGKNLVARGLEGFLPADLTQAFETWAKMPLLKLRRAIYQSERPNVYMARLSRFVADHIQEPAMRQLVYDRFNTFFDVTVMRYADYSDLPIHFVGSIAFYYREILEEVCRDKGLQVGRFVKSPADGLVEYHQKVQLS